MKKVILFLGLILCYHIVEAQIIKASPNHKATVVTSSPEDYPAFLLTDTYTAAWFTDASANVTRNGADLVSQWNDISGNARHLVQATETNRPTWSASGITFDGVDNYMETADFTIDQPTTIYMVLNILSTNASDPEVIYDGNLHYYGAIIIASGGGAINLYNGTWDGPYKTTAVAELINTLGLLTTITDGASSTMRINSGTTTGGDPGTRNMGGFTLGKDGQYVEYSNILVREILVRSKNDSSNGDDATIRSYLLTKYGI